MDIRKNIFAVNKPVGPTSFDVVERVREVTGVKRVGHAGTLDPLASGVLVIGIGREATKKLSQIVAQEKEYLVVIKLGEISETDDSEGEKTKVSDRAPEQKEIESALENFIGHIKQVPPEFSAVKVGGKRSYQAAREGKSLELKPREVFVKSIELVNYEYPMLKLKIVTGKGVYIRSLARDLGERLQIGAYVTSLTRTKVSEFNLNNSIKVEELKNKLNI